MVGDLAYHNDSLCMFVCVYVKLTSDLKFPAQNINRKSSLGVVEIILTSHFAVVADAYRRPRISASSVSVSADGEASS